MSASITMEQYQQAQTEATNEQLGRMAGDLVQANTTIKALNQIVDTQAQRIAALEAALGLAPDEDIPEAKPAAKKATTRKRRSAPKPDETEE